MAKSSDEEFSPTVVRRHLGRELREFRTAKGLQAEDVCKYFRWHPSKVSRIEMGRQGMRPADLVALCAMYEVSEDDRARLRQLLRDVDKATWWQDLVPPGAYVDFEAGAASIKSYDPLAIPGLLQTADYARSLVSAARPDLTADEVDQYVRARQERQRLLDRPRRLAFWAFIAEPALRFVVGSPDVMRNQVAHLLHREASSPNVTVQVLDFASGLSTGSDGGCALLAYRHDPSIGHVETAVGDKILEKPGDVDEISRRIDRLQADALPPAESVRYIQKVMDDNPWISPRPNG